MKKFLKILLAILAVLVIAMFVIGWNNYHYEKSIVINAPAEKCIHISNSMKAFNEWNPWMKLDPQFAIYLLWSFWSDWR